jgi:hypothetical protein
VEAQQPGHGPQRRGLAGAVRADQRDRAAGRDREADAVEREHRAAVRDAESLDLQQRDHAAT